MTTNVPMTFKKRKAHGAVALSFTLLVTLGLAFGVAGIGQTLATQSAKDETTATWNNESLNQTSTEAVAFNTTPGATITPQFISVTNTGGSNVKGHASFAPRDFLPEVPAALTDTVVHVWNATAHGTTDPAASGQAPYWEGPLGTFLDTSFIADTVITGGQSVQFGIAVATPYDVDANAWLSDGVSESAQQSIIDTLVVQADNDNESPLTRGSVWNESAGLRIAPASLVRDAAAALHGGGGGATNPSVSMSDDADSVPGAIVRSFYTDPSLTTFLGSILIDASKNETDADAVLDADYDDDGIRYDVRGARVN